MSDLANLKRRRRLTLLGFGLVTIFLFSGFVYGPSGTGRTAFTLEDDPTWEAAAIAEKAMPEPNHDAVVFIGPKWDTEGGNTLALSVLQELTTRGDEVMSNPEITAHFKPTYQWQVQQEISGIWGFAETVRAVMNQETPVSQQIGWNGSNFESATEADLNEVLTRLFSIQLEDGSYPYRSIVSGLQQQNDGSWYGRASFIRGIANSSSLFGEEGEYSKAPGGEKPFFEEWEVLIDDIYAPSMAETGEDVHVWSFLAIDTEVNDEVNQTMPLIGVSFILMVTRYRVILPRLA